MSNVKTLGTWPTVENLQKVVPVELRMELLRCCGHAEEDIEELANTMYDGPTKTRGCSAAKSDKRRFCDIFSAPAASGMAALMNA